MSEYSLLYPSGNNRAGAAAGPGGYYGGGAGRKTFKEVERNELRERKRCLLYLIAQYLREHNLHESADTLRAEAELNQYEVCDNIDLDMVLQDYQSYYTSKFNRDPKILRKLDEPGGNTTSPNNGNNGNKNRRRLSKNASKDTPVKGTPSSGDVGIPPRNPVDFQIDVTCLAKDSECKGGIPPASSSQQSIDIAQRRPSLCDFDGYTPEWREMAELIIREIVPHGSVAVDWSKCVGVDETIAILKEAIVYPLKYRELFTGLLSPWKGVLLYGPPGTGKTLLAKAVAGECGAQCTFINLTISTFVSKWRGESEKLLKVLFDVARFYAPSIIFIDELDAVASRFEDHQHEASRRFRSELLIQLDGLLGGNEHVFILATTNLPWNLNNAILRRFDKRILIGVPDRHARAAMFAFYLNQHPNAFNANDFEAMAAASELYTGCDIRLVCKEALMCTVREQLATIGKQQCVIGKLRKPRMDDVRTALARIRPSCTREMIATYGEWANKFGSV